jgi:hypothetical protein
LLRRIGKSRLSYIPYQCRPLIIPTVCAALGVLVKEIAPDWVYRVTKERNPVAKALPKYERITEKLQELRYEIVSAGVDPFGRLFWLMQRMWD